MKDNSAFSTTTRCYKSIAIKMLVLNTANFGKTGTLLVTKIVPGRYTFGKAGTLLVTKSVPGRYKFGNQKCTDRYNFRPVQFLRDRPLVRAGTNWDKDGGPFSRKRSQYRLMLLSQFQKHLTTFTTNSKAQKCISFDSLNRTSLLKECTSLHIHQKSWETWAGNNQVFLNTFHLV